MTMNTGQAALRPAAVLFDMDGTLVDSEKLWTIAMDDYANHRGGALNPSSRESMVGSNMGRSMQILLEDLGLPAGPAEIEQAAEWVAGRTADLFRQELPWRPGAQEALRTVRQSGTPTALVTSTIRSLTEIALDTLGRDSFDVTVCGDEVSGRNKPDPEPYSRACRLLEVKPDACVAIEDSPAGVASAVAAGCTVLAISCEVPLDPGPSRMLWNSLETLDMAALRSLFADAAL